MPKALISSEELIEHITNFIGTNPSKVVMSKDRISFIRGKQTLYVIKCQTELKNNQVIETKYIYEKWENALNYLCSIQETPIFLELLPKGVMKLTSIIMMK
jgi:hypothetical protein